MHRAALALGVAAGASGQFRHHAFRVHAAGQHVTVVAIAGDHWSVRAWPPACRPPRLPGRYRGGRSRRSVPCRKAGRPSPRSGGSAACRQRARYFLGTAHCGFSRRAAFRGSHGLGHRSVFATASSKAVERGCGKRPSFGKAEIGVGGRRFAPGPIGRRRKTISPARCSKGSAERLAISSTRSEIGGPGESGTA